MKTVHLLVDETEELNSLRETYCGLRIGNFPENHHWVEARLAAAHLAVNKENEPCVTCFPRGRPPFGTPISQLSGRPGEPGFKEFSRIAKSWGYD